MKRDIFRRWSVLGALATTPFLFGANGKGCAATPPGGDGGAESDGALSPPSEDAAFASDGSSRDAIAMSDGGACVSAAGGPCGGFTQAPCTCAVGLVCKVNRIPDIPGTCIREADACVDNVLCIRGDHWDPVQCKCVPEAGVAGDAGNARDAGCVDNVLCIMGDHWDPRACKCVPNASDGGGCATAADCHGALPQVCAQSCDGGPGACAHFVCQNGSCATVICE